MHRACTRAAAKVMWGGPEDNRREPRFYSAAICRRGHVESEAAELHSPGDMPAHCTTCGAPVLVRCGSCGTLIRGDYRTLAATNYQPPDFCHQCSAPFPWVSRQGRIYELMNLLDEEQLDPATELEVREQLEALTNPELDEDEASRRWARVKQKAPTLWENSGAQRILETVVAAAIKAQLDIK